MAGIYNVLPNPGRDRNFQDKFYLMRTYEV